MTGAAAPFPFLEDHPMSHPDPEIVRINDRNARACAEAIQAPPLAIADNPLAFLRWMRERPPAPPVPRPRGFLDVPSKWSRSALPRLRHEPRPPANTVLDTNAERNRQLAALAVVIKQQGQQIPAASEPAAAARDIPANDDVPEIS